MSQHEDYYIENGKLVFTAKYHLKRGYCCGNQCRNCPYDGRVGSTKQKPRMYNKTNKE